MFYYYCKELVPMPFHHLSYRKSDRKKQISREVQQILNRTPSDFRQRECENLRYFSESPSTIP